MAAKKSVPKFELNNIEDGVYKERMISIRVPEEHKMKFDIIQARSKKRFADHLRQAIIAEIEAVSLEKEEEQHA